MGILEQMLRKMDKIHQIYQISILRMFVCKVVRRMWKTSENAREMEMCCVENVENIGKCEGNAKIVSYIYHFFNNGKSIWTILTLPL
jgi:hypothetical protein